MNVRLLQPAQLELDEAIEWYDQQAPGLGEAFLIETLKVLRLIQQHPDAWHPLGPGVRRCRVNRFPYTVIYAREGEDLIVLAIAHQHRRPLYWRDRQAFKKPE